MTSHLEFTYSFKVSNIPNEIQPSRVAQILAARIAMQNWPVKFDRIYLLNGLARSGNHLAISWILSQLPNNSVYYINNLKPVLSGFSQYSKCSHPPDFTCLFDSRITRKKAEKIFNLSYISKKIVDDFEYQKGLLDLNPNNGKILLISLENKSTQRFAILSNIFRTNNNFYCILCMSDIFNTIASRTLSETILFPKNQARNNEIQFYKTDTITIDFWFDHITSILNRRFHGFNYNLFLTNFAFRENLAQTLGLDDPHVTLPQNKFGLTGGSSFKENFPNKFDRYKYCWTPLLDFSLRKNCLRYLCNIYMNMPLEYATPVSNTYWWNYELEMTGFEKIRTQVDRAHKEFIESHQFRNNCVKVRG